MNKVAIDEDTNFILSCRTLERSRLQNRSHSFAF